MDVCADEINALRKYLLWLLSTEMLSSDKFKTRLGPSNHYYLNTTWCVSQHRIILHGIYVNSQQREWEVMPHPFSSMMIYFINMSRMFLTTWEPDFLKNITRGVPTTSTAISLNDNIFV